MSHEFDIFPTALGKLVISAIVLPKASVVAKMQQPVAEFEQLKERMELLQKRNARN